MKLGIILEGPDCVGKSTVAEAIKHLAKQCGTSAEIKHSTEDIPTDYSSIPVNIGGEVTEITRRLVEFNKRICSANPISMFKFVIFDRVDDISGPIYDNPRNDKYDREALDYDIHVLGDRFGGRVSATVITSMYAFNRWRDRQNIEFIKDMEAYRIITTRYENIKETHFIKHLYNLYPYVTALQIMMNSISRALSYG